MTNSVMQVKKTYDLNSVRGRAAFIRKNKHKGRRK